MAPQFPVEDAWTVVMNEKVGVAAHVSGATPPPDNQASAQERIAYKRTAASAATAIACTVFRNCWLWPMKSPSAVKLLIVATAPPNLSVRGRMIETGGRWGLNSVGTGKIRLG